MRILVDLNGATKIDFEELEKDLQHGEYMLATWIYAGTGEPGQRSLSTKKTFNKFVAEAVRDDYQYVAVGAVQNFN